MVEEAWARLKGNSAGHHTSLISAWLVTHRSGRCSQWRHNKEWWHGRSQAAGGRAMGRHGTGRTSLVDRCHFAGHRRRPGVGGGVPGRCLGQAGSQERHPDHRHERVHARDEHVRRQFEVERHHVIEVAHLPQRGEHHGDGRRHGHGPRALDGTHCGPKGGRRPSWWPRPRPRWRSTPACRPPPPPVTCRPPTPRATWSTTPTGRRSRRDVLDPCAPLVAGLRQHGQRAGAAGRHVSGAGSLPARARRRWVADRVARPRRSLSLVRPSGGGQDHRLAERARRGSTTPAPTSCCTSGPPRRWPRATSSSPT